MTNPERHEHPERSATPTPPPPAGEADAQPPRMTRAILVSPQVHEDDLHLVPRSYLSILEARTIALAEGRCRACGAERHSLGVDHREHLHLELLHFWACPLRDPMVARIVARLTAAGVRVEAGVLTVDVPDGVAA